MTDLLKEVGLDNHILHNISEYRGVEQFTIENTEDLRDKKSRLRSKGIVFLNKALYGVDNNEA